MKKLSTIYTIFMVISLTSINSSPFPQQEEENSSIRYSSNWEGTEDFLTKTYRPIPSAN
jgi:hypothetical protein